MTHHHAECPSSEKHFNKCGKDQQEHVPPEGSEIAEAMKIASVRIAFEEQICD